VEQGIRTLNQKQTQMCKSQCRNIVHQSHSSPSKANSTTKDLNNSKKEGNIKYWIPKIIVRMMMTSKNVHKN
jgi:hypothetical protein